MGFPSKNNSGFGGGALGVNWDEGSHLKYWGAGCKEKQKVVRKLLKKCSFQLVLLQETMLEKVHIRFSRWFSESTSFQCKAKLPVGHSGSLITC